MRIWLDISLLIQRGHLNPVGLTRIEDSIYRELEHQEIDVGYIWIGTNSNIYWSLEKFSWVGQIQKRSPKLDNIEVGTLNSISRLSKQSRLKQILKICFTFLPIALQRSIFYILRHSKITKYRYRIKEILFHNSILRNNKLGNENTVENNNGEFFTKDDILLVTTNDWDRRIYEHLRHFLGFTPRLAFYIHDLIPFESPRMTVNLATSNRFVFWIGDISQRAEFIIFNSEATKKAHEAMLNQRNIISKCETKVIYPPLGIQQGLVKKEPGFAAKIRYPFFLYVSTIEARKNHKVLIEAMEIGKKLNRPLPQILFVGEWGWGVEDLKRNFIEGIFLESDFICTGGVSDQELAWLYENCQGVLFPSLSEGYGLSILEALWFRKKVICSDIAVFREIASESCHFVSPYMPYDWLDAITESSNTQLCKETTLRLNFETSRGFTQKIIDFLTFQESQ